MKVSEWANILQLVTVVFGGGALYQKIEYLAEAVKAQSGETSSLRLEIAANKIEIEKLRGKDALHELQLERLKDSLDLRRGK